MDTRPASSPPVDSPSGTDAAAPAAPAPAPARVQATIEARQRWRLTFSRVAPAGSMDVGRDYGAAWERTLLGSGLPVVIADSGRPRISFAAPLPLGVAGQRELCDLWLSERLPAWVVRESLEPVLPPGHAMTSLEDVWLGAPPLPGRVAGADYVLTLGTTDVASIQQGAGRLLAAKSLPRERSRAGGVKAYDLRPLLADVCLVKAGPPAVIRIRTLTHPELGTGRPEEVVAALADAAGSPIEVVSTVRQRLVLADDIG